MSYEFAALRLAKDYAEHSVVLAEILRKLTAVSPTYEESAGPVKTYTLESKAAHYPRIVIGNDCIYGAPRLCTVT